MVKTTIYLPADLKRDLKRVAETRGLSEAEIIRESIQKAVTESRPRPRGGLFSSGRPVARDADQLLHGFGER